jgi:hypothetical protein
MTFEVTRNFNSAEQSIPTVRSPALNFHHGPESGIVDRVELLVQADEVSIADGFASRYQIKQGDAQWNHTNRFVESRL